MMKICLACSAGGHYVEIMMLKELFGKHDHFFITVERENTKDLPKRSRAYFVEDTGKSMVKMLKNFSQTWKIIAKEKPDVVISTGAGAAIAACLIGKFMGSKIVFLESYCRIFAPSRSGRFVYRFADLFLVQWEKMLKFYPKAKYWGAVF
ncbi:MAG TPA: PssD/Cps14F family polysaccharide biosynthesis glycosyltransferase [archaeon]|nr:PssD/Cps14F family polysaccharide biosynthesis glycosyltransferase [archaeon]